MTFSEVWLLQHGYQVRINDEGREEWYRAGYGAPVLSHTQPQPNPVHEPAQSDAPKENSPSGRQRVVITSYRMRLLDTDNLAGGCKFLLDALRYANVIADDSPDQIELVVRQEKVNHRREQKTVVNIE